MSTPVDRDVVLETLTGLPAHDVSARRADEIRRRCHVALARRARRHRSVEAAAAWAWARVAEPAMVAGVSAMFLVEVVRRALRLYS
jgi:hypothetical protein